MNDSLSKWIYRGIMSSIIALSVLVRIHLISKTEYAPDDAYSTHLKTSLNYLWSYGEFENSDGRKWYKKQELFNAFFKLDKPFNYAELYDELRRSNHPPLYYYIIHTFQSFKANGRPFYIGAYVTNLIVFVMSTLLFARILIRFSLGYKATLLGTLWFSIAFGFMQNALSHKAYELQLLFSLALVLLVYEHSVKSVLKWSDYLWYGLFCCILYLLHYFSFLFLLMIGAVLLIYYGGDRERIKRIIYYGGTTFITALTVSLMFPFMIEDLITDNKSKRISDDLQEGAFFSIDRIAEVFTELSAKLVPVYLFIAIVVMISIYGSKVTEKLKVRSDRFLLILCLFSILFSIFSLAISPSVVKLRYGVTFLPYLIMLFTYILSVPFSKSRLAYIGVFLMILGWGVFGLFVRNPANVLQTYRDDQLYPETYVITKKAVLISKFGESMRTIIYNSPYEEFAFVNNNFDPLFFDNLSEITFIVRKNSRPQKYNEAMKYIRDNGFISCFQNRRYMFYKIP